MSWELDATDGTRQLSSPLHDGNNPKSLRASIAAAISMSLSLTTAGRLGFFIDYSELSDAGTHTFYVARTHGSKGAVSVAYATSGDGHTSVSGVLSWADEDMSIQSFTVAVTPAQLTNHQTTLGLGEHRIVARLSSPTGGGVLHFGTEETKAYGVIDNDVLASDANAVFYDSAAASVGDGTQATPYDSVYTAIAAIGTKRYLYGKGTTIVDGTLTMPDGVDTIKILPVPSTRSGEATRIYVRNWSGSAWTVKGNGTDTDVSGFFTRDNESFATYKGITFTELDTTDLDGSGASGNCFGILYTYGTSQSINIEGCVTDDIDGGGNTGAYMLWGVDGGKVWRCTANNIKRLGDNTTGNTSLFYTYDGKNISVQRCEATNVGHLTYQKRVEAAFDVSVSVKFCIDSTPFGVHYGASNSVTGVPHSYTIVQCNVFNPTIPFANAIIHEAGVNGSNGSNNGGKHWWCNNVFYQRGGGLVSPVQFRQAYSAIIFNNIYLDCVRLWKETNDSAAYGAVMEYADHEISSGTTLPSHTYEYQGTEEPNSADLQLVRPDFAVNDVISDPLFTDAANGDFSLQATSPALTGGVSGTQQGVYLGNFYTIGAAN